MHGANPVSRIAQWVQDQNDAMHQQSPGGGVANGAQQQHHPPPYSPASAPPGGVGGGGFMSQQQQQQIDQSPGGGGYPPANIPANLSPGYGGPRVAMAVNKVSEENLTPEQLQVCQHTSFL